MFQTTNQMGSLIWRGQAVRSCPTPFFWGALSIFESYPILPCKRWTSWLLSRHSYLITKESLTDFARMSLYASTGLTKSSAGDSMDIHSGLWVVFRMLLESLQRMLKFIVVLDHGFYHSWRQHTPISPRRCVSCLEAWLSLWNLTIWVWVGCLYLKK